MLSLVFKRMLNIVLSLPIKKVTPSASPRGTYGRSASEEQQPRDIVTLSAVNQQDCTCSERKRQKDGSVKSSSPEDDVFQHAPTSFCPKATDKE